MEGGGKGKQVWRVQIRPSGKKGTCGKGRQSQEWLWQQEQSTAQKGMSRGARNILS